jgi:hypothetical protein
VIYFSKRAAVDPKDPNSKVLVEACKQLQFKKPGK